MKIFLMRSHQLKVTELVQAVKPVYIAQPLFLK